MEKQTPKFNVEDVFKPTIDLQDTDELVAAEYQDKSIKQQDILDKHNISTSQLYDILNRKGIPLRNRMRSSKSNDRLLTMTKIEMDTFAGDYMQGMHLSKLYKKYNLNKHAVYKLVAQLGLPRRHKAGIKRSGKKSKKDKQMELKLMPESKVTTSFKMEDGTAHVYLVINSPTPIDKIQVHIEVPKEEK
ncbi:hypothetical protein [Bacillus phage BC-T25]|nr:hypothetical protein [Bacillus phage BC-T25]